MRSPRILTVGSGTAAPGETVSVPIWVNDPTGISGVQIALEYDPISLKYLGSQVGEDFSNFLVLSHDVEGVIHIAMTGSSIPSIPRTSSLVSEIRFQTRPDRLPGEISPVRLSGCSIIVGTERVSLIVQTGEVSVTPGAPSEKMKGISQRRVEDSPRSTRPYSTKKQNKQEKTPISINQISIPRSDFNFDGTVDSRDLLWLIGGSNGFLSQPGDFIPAPSELPLYERPGWIPLFVSHILADAGDCQ
ncbi:MAG: hypothetical protein H6752_02145 [Candidatus Omnitrophica bacterium]|nr:hypothetical protein [Candidatus Omnitrophota bacterium]